MKKKIYLDDIRTPVDPEWIIARDYDAFKDAVRSIGLDNIEVISLDHDLGDDAMVEYYTNVKQNYFLSYENIQEKTGYDCCKFLVTESLTTGIPLPPVYVHSANPIGAGNMMGYINNYYKNCKQPEICVRVDIPHTIEEQFIMSPEAREAKWKR